VSAREGPETGLREQQALAIGHDRNKIQQVSEPERAIARL